ncbi:MAG TPA: metallophosphatase family protein [Candidatus Blautia excrementipullorum]|nr:metallophosphatase family protein [Candidatus Blautia excrementipullorum]
MAKKLGIISDTHGLLRPEVMDVLRTCDCILHGGDINKPEILDELRPLASIYAVRGNNDREWGEGLAKTLRFTIEGVEFFMTHNKKDVDWNLGSAQVVIFGHTHKYFEKIIDGRLWLNPGSCGRRRFNQEITMAVMTVDQGTFMTEKIVIPEEK